MLAHISKKVESTKSRTKRLYFENILTNTPHSKIWQNIRSIFGHSKNQEKITLIDNGIETKNNQEACNIFNKFFSTIGQNLANNIPASSTCPFQNIPRVRESIFLRPSSPNEIVFLIQNLNNKKSSGPDNIPAAILKANASIFAKILSQIFNLIVQTGSYPDCLKIAKVVPIYKSGDTRDCNNYRPISTLSVFNKILEKLLVTRLIGFLNQHDVLYNLQYGFRQGYANRCY